MILIISTNEAIRWRNEMKTYIFLIAMIITSVCFAYTLQSKWIKPETITVYQDLSLRNHVFNGADSLANFDFNACVEAMNVNLYVDSLPLFIPSDTDYSDSCFVKYGTIYDEYGQIATKTYGTHTTDSCSVGQFDSFIITLNDAAEADWSELPGSYMDINTTLRHELCHSQGIGHNRDATSLMYEWSVGDPPWNNPITYIGSDEINGLRHVYTPPKLLDVYGILGPIDMRNDSIFVLYKDTLVIDLAAPPMLTYAGLTPPPLRMEGFKDANTMDSLSYAWIDSSYFRYKLTADTAKAGTFRSFIKRNECNSDQSEYVVRKSPCTTVKYKFVPYVSIFPGTTTKSYYSLDNTNTFNATCTDAYGNDYPYMDEVDGPMKFYYKEVGSEDAYTEIPEPPAKDLTVYSRVWDKGDLKGDYIVKATAFYYESAESTEVLTWSDSLTIRLLDNYQCEITEPNSYDVEAIDFEKFVDIKGLFYHDGSVDLDSISLGYSYIDLNNDYVRGADTKHYWYSYQLPYLPGLPVKKEKSDIAVFELENYSDKDAVRKNQKTVFADTVTWCEPLRNDTLYISEDRFYSTKPGLYTINANIYDTRYTPEFTSHDTLRFIKPSWKLKLQGDFWYQYGFQKGVPYKEKTIFAPEERIKLYQWRPFIERAIGTTYFDVSSEGINIDDFSYDGLSNNGYVQFVVNKPESLFYNFVTHTWEWECLPDSFFVSTALPAEWERTGSETPGFYTITATEYDPVAGCNAIQRKEIQIPPLYITAESGYDGIDWPSLLWPRGAEYEDMDNYNNWKTSTHAYNYATGSVSLASYYDSAEEKGRMELTHPGITINKSYNTEFQFAIGLKKELNQSTQEYNFEKLLADYSIALEIDGTEEIIKTATVDEWNEYDAMNQWAGDGNDSIHYVVKFTKPLGGRVGMGTEVKVKLITEGIPEFYIDSLEQTVLYDEICICYTRKVCPEGPAMATGYYKNVKGNDFVEISFNSPSDPKYVPEGYIIYRNGVKVGETTSTTFIDYNIQSNTTYRYAVTAKYTGFDYDESSMLDCAFTVSTGQITYPRPRDLVLTQGSGYEYNNVYLNWTEPIEEDSVAVYNVYRNDVIIASPDTTVFTDLWLNEGEYDYYITASYSDGGESINTDTCSVEIVQSSNTSALPLTEYFENGGTSPELWTSGTYINYGYPTLLNYWKYGSTNPLNYSAYEGSYLAYIGAGPVTGQMNETNEWAQDCLTSPILNLTEFKNVTITFKYLLQGDSATIDRTPQNFLRIEYSNNEPSFTPDGSPYWYWAYSSELYKFEFDTASDYTSEWETFNLTVSDSILTDHTVFQIVGQVDLDERNEYLYYSIDSLVISGTIKAEIPTGIQVSRDQGVTSVNWTAVQDATMYYIYRSDKPDVGYVEIGNTTSASFNDPDTELEDGVYFYKVVSEVTEKILSPGKVPLKQKEVSR